jgi:hypothetical protein
VFADLRGVPDLGNATIDMPRKRYCTEWNSEMDITFVYDNTSAGSHLRKYTVDRYTLTVPYSKFKKSFTADDVTIDFLLDAMPLVVQRGVCPFMSSRQGSLVLDRCQWQDHSGPGGKLRLESRK